MHPKYILWKSFSGDDRYPQNQYWNTSHYQSERITSLFIIKSNLCLTHQRCLLRRNEHFWIWCVLMRILQKNLNRRGKRRHYYPLWILSSGGFQICSVSSENRIAQVTLKRNEKINNCMSCGYKSGNTTWTTPVALTSWETFPSAISSSAECMMLSRIPERLA